MRQYRHTDAMRRNQGAEPVGGTTGATGGGPAASGIRGGGPPIDNRPEIRELISTVRQANKAELEADHKNMMQQLRLGETGYKATVKARRLNAIWQVATLATSRSIEKDRQAFDQFQRLQELKAARRDRIADGKESAKNFKILEGIRKFEKRSSDLLNILVKATPGKAGRRAQSMLDKLNNKENQKAADSRFAKLGKIFSKVGKGLVRLPEAILEGVRAFFINITFGFRVLFKTLRFLGLALLGYNIIKNSDKVGQFVDGFLADAKDFFENPLPKLANMFKKLGEFFNIGVIDEVTGEFDFNTPAEFLAESKKDADIIFSSITEGLSNLKTSIEETFSKDGMTDLGKAFTDGIVKAITFVIDKRADTLSEAFEFALGKVINGIGTFFSNLFQSAYAGLMGSAGTLLDNILGMIPGASKLFGSKTPVMDALRKNPSRLMDFFNADGTINENAPMFVRGSARAQGNFLSTADAAEFANANKRLLTIEEIGKQKDALDKKAQDVLQLQDQLAAGRGSIYMFRPDGTVAAIDASDKANFGLALEAEVEKLDQMNRAFQDRVTAAQQSGTMIGKGTPSVINQVNETINYVESMNPNFTDALVPADAFDKLPSVGYAY